MYKFTTYLLTYLLTYLKRGANGAGGKGQRGHFLSNVSANHRRT